MPGLEHEIPRYLQNTDEVTVPEESFFSGDIPEWLQGNLLTSSPGIFDLDNGSVNNWFDGYAIISKFDIKASKVTFSSKYLQSNAYQKAHKAQKPIMPEFGTPPSLEKRKGLFSYLMPFGPYDVTDNCVGTIFKLGCNLYTASDTSYFHEIDLSSLGTLQTFHTLKVYGMNIVSPQPLVDNCNGDVYLIGAAIHPTYRYSVLKMSAQNEDNKVEQRFEPICSFPSRWMFGGSPCLSSFSITKNYVIFIETPLVLNIMKLAATHIKGYSCMDWLDWKPEDSVRFYLINKSSGKVIKTEMFSDRPFVTTCVANAYEEDNEIILDLISYPNLDCNQATTLRTLRSQKYNEDKRILETGTLHRYIIPLILDIKQCPEDRSLLKFRPNSYSTVDAIRKGQRLILTPECLSEPGQGFDFGIINPSYRGKKYSFVYNTSGYISNSFSPYAYGIAKCNVDTKEVLMWVGKPNQVPSEVVFVPNPCSTSSAEDEDSGILLTVVKMERSYEEDHFLVAVDSKTMKEIGRAYFKCPIAGWLHATFMKSSSPT